MSTTTVLPLSSFTDWLAFGERGLSSEAIVGHLVDHWDEIHEAIEAEVPDYLGRWATGNAANGYRLMKRVIAGGESCGACDGTGHGNECSACKGTGRRSGGRCRARGCYGGHDRCATCRGAGYVGGVA